MASASSDSNITDPTSSPSSSPSSPTNPIAESSTQAQNRAFSRTHHDHQSTTTPRSPPPRIAISKPTPVSTKHKSSPIRPNPNPPSSSQPSHSQFHHPGPFTSSPSQSPSLSPIPHLHPPTLVHQPPQQRRIKRKPSTQSLSPRSSLIPKSSKSESKSTSASASASASRSNSPHKPKLQSKSRLKSRSKSKPPNPPPSNPTLTFTPSLTNTYHTRPNRYLGASSTWRSWTEQERTVSASLERMRAQDLSIHLYNAYVLRRQDESARGLNGRSRTRSRSRSQGRGHSRSQSQSHSRGRQSSSRPSGKSKGKQKARASSADTRASDSGSDKDSDASPDKDMDSQQLTFMPPRVWTAWPLPPDEVPREEFLSRAVLGSGAGGQGEGYRRKGDVRPSAELEECLIAITSRFAKERWESRAWEVFDDDDDNEVYERSKKRKHRYDGNGEDMKMEGGGQGQNSKDEEYDIGTEQLDLSSSLSSADDGGIKLFSSQAFTALSSSEPSSSSSGEETETTASRPVFSADDDQIRDLLLPSTRHVMSQLDKLLLSLHQMQMNGRRKAIEIGGRGHEEVLGIAELFFSIDVVERAHQRCGLLFETMK